MSRILLATYGSFGDVNPYVALGMELRRRGHQALVAAPEPFRAHVTGAGLGFAPLRPEADVEDPVLMRKLLHPVKGGEAVIRDLVAGGIRLMYEDLEAAAVNAEFVVSHVLTFAAPLLAEKRKLPWVSTVLSPLVFFSKTDLPILAPAPNLTKNLRALAPTLHGLMLDVARWQSGQWMRPITELRASLGLPDRGNPLFEGQHNPKGALALFSSAFAAPQADWPANTAVCGFPFLDADFERQPADPRLAGFLADGDAPLVFTLGSSAVQIADRFYHDAADAARALKRRAVLVAGPAAESFAPADDLLAIKSAPYHELFPRAAAIVHSGGIGTTAQALRSGKPQIVTPYAHDQFDNAARVERIGAGLWLADRAPETIAATLERLLGDSKLAAQAARIGKTVSAENGVKTACDRIEDLQRA
jgi:rhamnosyltransferase subunit B